MKPINHLALARPTGVSSSRARPSDSDCPAADNASAGHSAPAHGVKGGRVLRGISAKQALEAARPQFQLRIHREDMEALVRVPFVAEALAAERSKHLADLREEKRQYIAKQRLYFVQRYQALRADGWSLNKVARVLGVAPSKLCTYVNRFNAVGFAGLLPSKLRVGGKRVSRDAHVAAADLHFVY